MAQDYPDETVIEYLQRIPVDTMLYTIEAQAEPDYEFEIIGELVTRSELVTSLWADTKMLFRHTRFDDDVMYRPEWLEAGFP